MIKYLLPQSVLNWYDDNKELLIVVAIAGALFAVGFLLGLFF